jgi:hypothetical protein
VDISVATPQLNKDAAIAATFVPNTHLQTLPILDSSFTREGLIIGASKTARDITERTRIETEPDKIVAREQQAQPETEIANRLKEAKGHCGGSPNR